MFYISQGIAKYILDCTVRFVSDVPGGVTDVSDVLDVPDDTTDISDVPEIRERLIDVSDV